MVYKRSTKPRRAVKKYAKKRKTSVPIKRTIQRILANNIETKTVTYTLSPTDFNSGIGSNEYYTILPPCPQGIGQTNRIGESIQPVKIVVNGYVNFRANSVQSAQEIIARMFCFQDKSVKSWDLRTNMDLGLLDTGGSGSTFDGTLLNTCVPHNNDQFKFYLDKRHTFLKSFGYTNNGVVTSAMTSMNSSLVWKFRLVLTKKDLPASLKYDGSSWPVNFNPVIALGYAYAQNDSPDTISTQLTMSYASTLYYKDA